MNESNFRRIVAASAWYDLLVTAPLATPWTLEWFLSTVAAIHSGLGLAGEVPANGVALGLFGTLLGSVVVVWSLARIRSPEPWLGRYDALARFLFATWMVYALLNGFSPVLLGFLVVEIAWGVVQCLPVRRPSEAGEAGALRLPRLGCRG